MHHTPHDHMTQALALAAQGRYTVSPNPMVGCVIVKNGKIVGEGFHHHAGAHHAEVHALLAAGHAAQDATAYVTLEPCCHYGKTPPCTQALIQAGIKKVVVACLDPNPLVSGKGLTTLKNAGIIVEIGLCESEATQLNAIFFHYIQTQRPFVISKWAMSLDGKTVTHPQDNKHISGSASHQHAHDLRQQVDAILIGAETARLDNPLLTARFTEEKPKKQPHRIILSASGCLPNLNLFSETNGKTWIITTPEGSTQPLPAHIEKIILPPDTSGYIPLPLLLTTLGEKQITSLLVEGGMHLHEQFFQQNLVNQCQVYLAPVFIGKNTQKQTYDQVQLATLEQDYVFTVRMKEYV